jgi:hypothetical protein
LYLLDRDLQEHGENYSAKSVTDIIRVIKLKTMRWAGHVAGMGVKKFKF